MKLRLRSCKQALYELICETFKTEREKIQVLHEQPPEDALLKIGAEKHRQWRLGSARKNWFECNKPFLKHMSYKFLVLFLFPRKLR
jgi:hypothetical protein